MQRRRGIRRGAMSAIRCAKQIAAVEAVRCSVGCTVGNKHLGSGIFVQELAGLESCWLERLVAQFNLRTLFALTAWIAVLMAIAVSSLSAWLMTALGFSMTTMNCAGKLAAIQAPRSHRRAVLTAWWLLLTSLMLPAVRGCGNDAVPGYRAAAVAVLYQLQPPVDQPAETWLAAYLEFSLLNLANLLLIVSPLFIPRVERGKGQIYGVLLATGAAAMWCTPIGETPGSLLAGYYVWSLAPLCLLASIGLRWWVLTPMIVLALVKSIWAGW